MTDQDELGLFAQGVILSHAVELPPSTVQLWHTPDREC